MAAEVDIHYTVQARDNLGRYLAKLDRALAEGLFETAQEGERVAKGLATVKTGAMRDSIRAVMLGDREAALGVGTDHWKAQEYGTPRHAIPADVHFWWAKEGRPWFPSSGEIDHPGNRAVGFMAAARSVMRERLAHNIKDKM